MFHAFTAPQASVLQVAALPPFRHDVRPCLPISLAEPRTIPGSARAFSFHGKLLTARLRSLLVMVPTPSPSPSPVWRPPASRRAGRRRGLTLLRPLPVALLLGWWGAGPGLGPAARGEGEAAPAVIAELGERGLQVAEEELHWVEPPSGGLTAPWRDTRVIFRAVREGEPADIYLAALRFSPEGRLLQLRALYPLTETSAADERQLTQKDERAAWLVGDEGGVEQLHVIDLRGEALPTGEGWGRLARWQAQLTNWQETGSRYGVKRRSFKLSPAPKQVELQLTPVAVELKLDGRLARVSTEPAGHVDGEALHEELVERARPGNLVTWAVDRVRALPWFGADNMQLVKAVAFEALDLWQRARGNVTGDDGSAEVVAELGELPATLTTFTDPETGWPPAPLEPMLKPIEGEGKWRLVEDEAYVRSNPEAPAAFATTFIRTDPVRAYSQIWILAWDPRQVALHTMSGTVEPKSATGETGPGLVPRKPEVMGRLVGAFNGGFQATHGEFGMMADGVMYLPPKPYAATVAELSDGSTGFGTWPNDEHVPDTIVSFRQNMTPLVMDGTINPYKRTWWGGVPPGWTDESRTTRSAVCLTKEHFVAYLYGSTIDADALAFAMQRARCVYGIHLDMNAGHTGFEFYRAAPSAELPPLEPKPEPRWQAEGEVRDMPGWSFRGRRLLKYMGLMNFPRYIQRESRDFLYLTLRHVLPGPPLTPLAGGPAEGDEGAWTVKGLPQHGWPYVIAKSWLRADGGGRWRALRLDPRWLSTRAPEATDGSSPTGDGALVASFVPASGAGESLWLTATGVQRAARAPEPSAVALATGSLQPSNAAAVLAHCASDGMLLYLERDAAATSSPRAVEQRLDALQCADRIWLSEPWRIALGGQVDLEGKPVPMPARTSRLYRGLGPGGRRIFPDTPVVPLKEWYALQAKRVRYHRKPKVAEPSVGGQEAPPATAPPSAPAEP